MGFFQFIDYAGVAVFAATGALAASRKQLDIIGFIFLASLTGIGGGTIRDLVLGIRPVFWVSDSGYLLVTIGIGIALFFTARLVEYRYRLLLWLDAVGLAAYAVLGAHIGLAAGSPPLVAVVTGMMTAAFGGLLRDVVSGEPTVLMRKEIYVTAALCGSTCYVAMSAVGVEAALAALVAVPVAFVIRGGALAFGWTLPGYGHLPGRPQSAAGQPGASQSGPSEPGASEPGDGDA